MLISVLNSVLKSLPKNPPKYMCTRNGLQWLSKRMGPKPEIVHRERAWASERRRDVKYVPNKRWRWHVAHQLPGHWRGTNNCRGKSNKRIESSPRAQESRDWDGCGCYRPELQSSQVRGHINALWQHIPFGISLFVQSVTPGMSEEQVEQGEQLEKPALSLLAWAHPPSKRSDGH